MLVILVCSVDCRNELPNQRGQSIETEPVLELELDPPLAPDLYHNIIFLLIHVTHSHRVLAQLLPSASTAYESLQANREKSVELKKEGKRTSDPDVDVV